jgi:hypothetical protein
VRDGAKILGGSAKGVFTGLSAAEAHEGVKNLYSSVNDSGLTESKLLKAGTGAGQVFSGGFGIASTLSPSLGSAVAPFALPLLAAGAVGTGGAKILNTLADIKERQAEALYSQSILNGPNNLSEQTQKDLSRKPLKEIAQNIISEGVSVPNLSLPDYSSFANVFTNLGEKVSHQVGQEVQFREELKSKREKGLAEIRARNAYYDTGLYLKSGQFEQDLESKARRNEIDRMKAEGDRIEAESAKRRARLEESDYFNYIKDKSAGFARGGRVPSSTDTIPAMLTPGEYVVRKERAMQYGGLLDRINNGTMYRASGGEAKKRYYNPITGKYSYKQFSPEAKSTGEFIDNFGYGGVGANIGKRLSTSSTYYAPKQSQSGKDINDKYLQDIKNRTVAQKITKETTKTIPNVNQASRGVASGVPDLSNFQKTLDAATSVLQKLDGLSINVKVEDINVNITGADALKQVQGAIVQEVSKQLTEKINEHFTKLDPSFSKMQDKEKK